MEATYKSNGPVLSVALLGDLTGGADAMVFARSFKERLVANKVTQVAIDVAAAGFVNSSGLGMLLAARQTTKDAGAEFIILNPPLQLRTLLEITKLSEILGVTTG